MEWLLISSPRGLERHAVSERRRHLKACGFPPEELKPEKEKLSIIGLSLIRIDGSAHEVISRLKARAEDNPWGFRLVLKVKPIQRIVETSKEAIIEVVKELSSEIPSEASFRVKLERRLTNIDRKELIFMIAKEIDRPVDLESSQWIVLIEILDKQTGISVVPREDILSLAMIRRGN